nr:hypothetical protein Iba_scaffold39154CG0010 [Ipomoea batatas]GMD86120.1 hypothetical protein Iba_chr14bCG3020 [Ipomoea batatas]
MAAWIEFSISECEDFVVDTILKEPENEPSFSLLKLFAREDEGSFLDALASSLAGGTHPFFAILEVTAEASLDEQLDLANKDLRKAREAFSFELNAEDCLISLSFLVWNLLEFSSEEKIPASCVACSTKSMIGGCGYTGRLFKHINLVIIFRFVSTSVGILDELLHHFYTRWEVKREKFAFVEEFVCWGSGGVPL